MSLEAAILAKLNQSGGSQTIDDLLAKLPAIDAGTSASTSTTDLDQLNILFGSAVGMTMVVASTTAVNAVIASTTAMNVVAASTTAMNAVAASTTAMNAVAASTTAMNAVAASTTAMNAVIASTTAMNAVAASATAMNAVAASTTAMNAVIASTTAMNALYAAPSITKVNYATGAHWGSTVTVTSVNALLVRVTTQGRPGGWGEGTSSTNQDKIIIGGIELLMSARAANPYNHSSLTASPRVPPAHAPTGIQHAGYDPVEIAYIPL